MAVTSLRTFLANISLDTVECVAKYKGYNTGKKGHKYFWSSQKGIRDMVIDNAPYDLAVGYCGSIKKTDERITNQKAIKSFHDWLLKNPRSGFLPPTATISAPQGELEVRINPDVGLLKGSKREVVLCWAYPKLALTQRVAGLGVWLMKTHLSEQCEPGTNFYVHDLVKGRRYSDKICPVQSAEIVNLELRRQEDALLMTKAA